MNTLLSRLSGSLTAATIAFLLLAPAARLNAQSSGRWLLALSKTDHTLAMVDPATLKVVARLPVGEDPHEVIASADGKTAYVSIYGGGSLHELSVLDLVNRKALPSVDTRPLWGPHGLVFVDGKAWFSAEGSKAVGRYDPATGKLDWSMGTGQERTHMIFVTPDGKRVYTTNVTSGTVSILVDTLLPPGPMGPPPGQNPPGQTTPPPGQGSPGQTPPAGPPPGGGRPREEWRQTVIPVSRGSEGFDVSPDGKELWTAASEDGSISVVDLRAKKLAEKWAANVNGANRLKFTPDGKQVFIASLSTGDLIVIDVDSHKELKRIKIGRGIAGILMDPVDSRAFVACSADSYIAIVSLKTLEVTGKLEVGGVPDGLAWAVRP